jgi:hypothetical protein
MKPQGKMSSKLKALPISKDLSDSFIVVSFFNLVNVGRRGLWLHDGNK